MFTICRIIRHRINTDGNGITSLVALPNCPLSCKYCLNAKALNEYIPYQYSEQELLDNLLQDACYMIATDGGVCFGGGEPLLQYKSIVEFSKIKPEWMKINVETSLQISKEAIIELIPYIDYWIIDIKTLDSDIYKNYTEGNIDQMLENLNLLAKEVPHKCKIRVPIIPNYKDNDIANKEAEQIKNLGFNNIEVFNYIIR